MKPFLLLAAATALALIASPAQAQFGGCYVGTHAGGAVTATRASAGGSSDGGAMTSGLVGTQIGCNGMISKKAFIGAELSGDLHGLHQGTGIFPGVSGGDLDRSISAIARAGYAFAPHTAAYVGAGYGWTWLGKIGDSTMSFSVPRAQAPLLLTGIEWRGFKHVSVDARYTAAFNRSDSFAVDPTTSVKIESVSHAFRLGVNWYFNDPNPVAAKLPGKP